MVPSGYPQLVRYVLPQPYRDLEHTADVGVEVEGATAMEALARLVLAEASLLTGGAVVPPSREERVVVTADGPTSIAIAVLRELLFRFATERTVVTWCEVIALDALAGAEVRVGVGRFDPEQHADGLDLKAVTLHQALLAAEDGRWRGRVVFDI